MAKIKEIDTNITKEFRNFKKVFVISYLENVFVGGDLVNIVGVDKISDFFNEDRGWDEDDIISINTMQVGQTINCEDISGYPLVTRVK